MKRLLLVAGRWLVRTRGLSPIEIASLGAVACWVLVRTAGANPIVLFDTAYEQSYVSWCLQRGFCPLFGPPTNLRGFWQGGCWTYLRVALEWLGLGIGHVHLALIAFDSVAVSLVGLTAGRIWGRTAGWLAFALCLGQYALNPLLMQAVHNSRFILAPAALATCLVIEGAGGKRSTFVVLALLICSCLANVHASALPLAAGTVLAAAAQTRRVATNVLALGLLQLVLIVAWSPGVWVGLPSLAGRGSAQPAQLWLGPLWLSSCICCGLLPVLELSKLAVRIPSWNLLVFLLAPTVVLYPAGQLVFGVRGGQKYMLHMVPALSFACAAIFSGTAGFCLRLARGVFGSTASSPFLKALRRASVALVPPLLGMGLLYAQPGPPSGPAVPAIGDAVRLSGFLKGRGWTLSRIFRRLKSPEQHALLSSILAFSPLEEIGPGGDSGQTSFYALVLDRGCTGSLAGSGAVEMSHDARSRTWMGIEADSALVWNEFDTCVESKDGRFECSRTSFDLEDPKPLAPLPLPAVLPPAKAVAGRRVRLVFRIGQGLPTRRHAVSFPPLRWACRGRIVEVRGRKARITEGGRKAVLLPGTEAGGGGQLSMEFAPGSEDCPLIAWNGFVPF
ncbi:MAG: hypothetical protein D6806_05455, partial [Deltaproteobacteria bacterium]